ncbi:MAG: HD domain-containing protein [Bacteroidales bacterium]|nr:HD domain-containing protein [Bacteroidales bacterium]
MSKKKKIVNDPVYGFINIPAGLIYDIIEHKYFQRLRRIKQLGLTYLVYPGAVHTRFHHALGTMHLMSIAIDVIRSKGHVITNDEAEAAMAAILLHDIGHGPFSHALESCIIPELPHEALSLMFMEELNYEFNGKLDLAIKIFKNEYQKKFLHQLISGQLDMDRLDYLRRDSFYTGVSEGIVGSERIIKMLQVVDDNLVVEAKGIYSIEKFLVARRLMYWQVYLHKTVLVGEVLLVKLLERLKHLYERDEILVDNQHLEFFLKRRYLSNQKEVIQNFYMLDDYDIISLLKQNIYSKDKILAHLSKSVLNRDLPKIIVRKEPFLDTFIENIKQQAIKELNINSQNIDFYVYSGEISNNAYSDIDERINILYGDKLLDIAEASDMLNLSVLSKVVKKYYVCGPEKIINSNR